MEGNAKLLGDDGTFLLVFLITVSFSSSQLRSASLFEVPVKAAQPMGIPRIKRSLLRLMFRVSILCCTLSSPWYCNHTRPLCPSTWRVLDLISCFLKPSHPLRFSLKESEPNFPRSQWTPCPQPTGKYLCFSLFSLLPCHKLGWQSVCLPLRPGACVVIPSFVLAQCLALCQSSRYLF